MKNHCENPGYDVTLGQIICEESSHFNQMIGELTQDYIDETGTDVEVWLSTIEHKGKRVQVHLKITADPDDFIDEN
ncbi:hypothetical protein KUL118_01380 [Tenacibaculum sp. KUL118]|nr:hypothetical protein KUL118_01380 [Tenacibaculum sp. KUL118]